tara:strand:+ start:12927 stop:13304 length:378 start_codon:yes stop_codon:yes gene_type:complete
MELIAVTLFILKHTIADYFTQYSWMIKDKATYGAFGGLAHAGWHGVLTSVIVWHLTILSLFPVILFGLLDSIIHYHIDYAKSNVWKHKKYTSEDQMYWVIHGVDQMLHFLTYIFIIWILIKISAI